jgi:hypothetical protein
MRKDSLFIMVEKMLNEAFRSTSPSPAVSVALERWIVYRSLPLSSVLIFLVAAHPSGYSRISRSRLRLEFTMLLSSTAADFH